MAPMKRSSVRIHMSLGGRSHNCVHWATMWQNGRPTPTSPPISFTECTTCRPSASPTSTISRKTTRPSLKWPKTTTRTPSTTAIPFSASLWKHMRMTSQSQRLDCNNKHGVVPHINHGYTCGQHRCPKPRRDDPGIRFDDSKHPSGTSLTPFC